MPIDVLMPALSPTMQEGALARWHGKVGDEVKSGDVIAEIETDKATMEVEAVDEGKVQAILVPEGAQGVKVNTPIARLAHEKGRAAPATPPAASAPRGGKTGRPRPSRAAREGALRGPGEERARRSHAGPALEGSGPAA